MKKLTTLLLAVLVLTAGLGYGGTCQAADTIRINGSGNALDMMKPLITAYLKTNRDLRVEMEKPLGSSGAVKALLAGALDMAVVSRDLKPEEAVQGARLRKYGKTPLAIVTEKNVRTAAITSKELEEIYAGTTTHWHNGEKIRLVLRPRDDTDTHILRTLSSGMNNAISAAIARPGMIIAITDPESYTTIAKTPGGLGAAGLNSIISEKLPLSILSLNGVKPSVKTLLSGAYPLAKEFSFITTAKTPLTAQKFIDFIFSPQGRAIAEKAGVLVTAGPAAGK